MSDPLDSTYTFTEEDWDSTYTYTYDENGSKTTETLVDPYWLGKTLYWNTYVFDFTQDSSVRTRLPLSSGLVALDMTIPVYAHGKFHSR